MDDSLSGIDSGASSQRTNDIDPFLVDDEDSSEPEPSLRASPPPESTQSLASSAAVDVSLRSPSKPDAVLPPVQPELIQPESYSLSPSNAASYSNVNKDVPPPPAHSDSEDDAAPVLQLPGLTMPSMFLPIPNVCVS